MNHFRNPWPLLCALGVLGVGCDSRPAGAPAETQAQREIGQELEDLQRATNRQHRALGITPAPMVGADGRLVPEAPAGPFSPEAAAAPGKTSGDTLRARRLAVLQRMKAEDPEAYQQVEKDILRLTGRPVSSVFPELQ